MNSVVEILSVGNELLLGNTINTNAAWIATQVTSAGAEVSRITTVGDNLTDISNALNESLRRKPDFLIITGGIGPTFDDMTLKGVAKGLGRRMKQDRDAVRLIRGHYSRRFKGKTMRLTKTRMKMAQIPQGSVPIHNPLGTAPAVLLTVNRTQIFCLPGVPSEAKAIFLESILGKIRTKASGRSYLESWVKISGIMESSLAPIIGRVMSHAPGIYIKSHPRGIENDRPQLELHFSTFTTAKSVGIRNLRKAVNEMKTELRTRAVRVRVGTQPSWNAP
ncbi:MAG TPA: molybdopterin-binding protein [Candidatus Dormibacteraeota bacterium]|nr:molybdopterin-binding protein [Candidatus Dormibacteraeota bacterium]